MSKLKFQTPFIVRLVAGSVLLLTSFLALVLPASAQPVLGAHNTALGGGGTAYLTGYEATFWNPANMAIHDRRGTLHVGAGQMGVIYEPVLSSGSLVDQGYNFTDTIFPYKPSAVRITSAQRQDILKDNYPGNTLLSKHQSRADVFLAGASWQRKDGTLSFAARARLASRIEVGRGWYSDEFIADGGQEVRDFTLNQQINQQLEFSVGYALEFTFVNGLLPRLSKIYVGIAPKLVLAGPNLDATYDGRYIRSGQGDSSVYTTDFSYRTTGEYSRATLDFRNNSTAEASIDNNLNRKFKLDNTGYGLGFDFGLTYLLPLGEDLSILEEQPGKSGVGNSLRVAFSINDIGLVRYVKDPLELSAAEDTVLAQEPAKGSMFIGASGQYLSYLDKTIVLPNPITSAEMQNSGQFSSLLPTSMNAGILLDLTRVKLMGDLRLGLNNTAFTSTKLVVNLGLETRPVQPVPIRFGARVASGMPTHLGMGTGLETRYIDFNIGTQVMLQSRTLTSEFVGGAFAGLQLHF